MKKKYRKRLTITVLALLVIMLGIAIFKQDDPITYEYEEVIVSSGDTFWQFYQDGYYADVCYSEALYNHKAILFNEKDGFIAFPASITKEAGEYDNGVPMYGDTIFNGALIYDISAEDGISLRGKISHNNDGKFNNNIERIIYIGDKFYTVSPDTIMASDIETVERISKIEF